jgi:hypothetical protein
MPTKTETAFSRFAAALREIGPTLGKTADNPFFKSKYLPLPVLLTEVRPILDKHHLVLTYPNGFAYCEAPFVNVAAAVRCAFTGEEVARSEITLPCPSDAQKATAAVTYGRRTVTASVLGIAEKDDDGNSTQVEAKREGAGGKTKKKDGEVLW